MKRKLESRIKGTAVSFLESIQNTEFLFLFLLTLSSCTISGKITEITETSSSGTLSYNLGTAYLKSAEAISIPPIITGSISSYSISPALPAGLSLNSTTGYISGTATTPTLSKTYTITGTLASGSTVTYDLTFEVAGFYTVNTTTDAVDAAAGDGVCATAASQCSLRAATQEAAAQATGTLAYISVPAGTYTLAGSGVTVSSRVYLTGAGSTSTFISGGGAIGPVITATGSEMIFDSVSVRNGFQNAAAGLAGSGISATTTGTMILKNCDISNNQISGAAATSAVGAGVRMAGAGTFTIDSCTITNNVINVTNTVSTSAGAGIAATSASSTLNISNSSFTSNSNIAPSALGTTAGGAIYSLATLTLTSSTVSNNSLDASSNGIGAGIYISAAGRAVTINKLTCAGNTNLVIGSAYGGCLSVQSSTNISISDSTFGTGNQAVNGSGFWAQSSIFTIQNSSFTGSFTGQIMSSGLAATGTSSIKNTTVYNTGNNNGVELTSSGFGLNYSLEHVTIQHNNAAAAGLRLALGAADTFTIKNSILDRLASNACSFTGGGTKTSLGYNVSRDATCTFLSGTGDVQSSATIGLSALASNGGFSQTMAIGTGSSAYNLVPAGSCSLTTDQRGTERPRAGACDAGAFEL